MRFRINALNIANLGTGIVLTLGVPTIFGKQLETLVGKFKANTEWELKPIRQKRSLDSNAFAWKICTEIANVVGNTKEDVYRDAISHVGVYETLQFTDDEAMERFKAKWRTNGEGWLTKTLDRNKRILMAYYGSSSYDTKEMSVLIDYLVRQADDLGIQVLTEEQIELMKTEWK